MKKIFAIALALVMVLSMASAFAMNCLTLDWSTSTNCGTGKVEVLPYVVGNKFGGQNTYTASDCAAAVNNKEVYYTVKVTVDEKPNKEWWDNATLYLTYDGMTVGGDSSNTLATIYEILKGTNDEIKAGEYYLLPGWTAVKASDFVANATTLFEGSVTAAEKAKVCAKIESAAAVAVGSDATSAIELNGAKVWLGEGSDFYEIWVDDVSFRFEKTGKFLQATVHGKTADHTYYSMCDGKYISDGGEYAEAACYNKDDYKAINDALAAIQITWGQKISFATAKAVLGWKQSVSDCAKWNDEAMSIVNAECQVQVMSIPKTGDKGLLWWLF